MGDADRGRRRRERWRRTSFRFCSRGAIRPRRRALRLDYYALKKRAAAAVRSGERVPEFMEILPGGLPTPRPECTIELEDASGTKMRIHLQGGDLPDVAALTRVFREGRS